MELSAPEIELCREIGFEPEVALALKLATGNAVERAYQRTAENWEMQPANALCSLNTRGEALAELRAALAPAYRAYWGMREKHNGLEAGDELVVLKGTDPMAMVRLRRPDGANYGTTHEDVLARLEKWHSLYGIDIRGADHDRVEMNFAILPKNLVAFAEEVYSFCTDVTEPEGDEDDEERDPELFKRALELPAVSPEFAERYIAEMREYFDDYPENDLLGIKMLAADIEKQRGLYLWWD